MSIEDTARENEIVVGETSRSPSQYFLRVSRVFFTKTNEGSRIRITLLRGSQYIRAIEFTEPFLGELIGLLSKAREP